MMNDILHNADGEVMRAPAALSTGANNTSWVAVGDQVRPFQAIIVAAAISDGTVTITAETADDSSGTNSVAVPVASILSRGIAGLGDHDRVMDVANEILAVQFTATKPYVRLILTSVTTTGIAGVFSMGQRKR